MPCSRISKTVISRPVAVEYPDMVGSFVPVATNKQSLPTKTTRKIKLPALFHAHYARKLKLQKKEGVATRPDVAPFSVESRPKERKMVCLCGMQIHEMHLFLAGGRDMFVEHASRDKCHCQ